MKLDRRHDLRTVKVERLVPKALLEIYAASPLRLTSRSENAIHLTLSVLIAFLFLFGCQSMTNYVPPVTSEMATTEKLDLRTLRQGRLLFSHRCIECHALPPLWHYSREDWPEIVNSMSDRASLKPAERKAIVAYILALRAQ